MRRFSEARQSALARAPAGRRPCTRAATSWVFSALASGHDFILHIEEIGKRLVNRYISRDSAWFRRFCPPVLAACQQASRWASGLS